MAFYIHPLKDCVASVYWSSRVLIKTEWRWHFHSRLPLARSLEQHLLITVLSCAEPMKIMRNLHSTLYHISGETRLTANGSAEMAHKQRWRGVSMMLFSNCPWILTVCSGLTVSALTKMTMLRSLWQVAMMGEIYAAPENDIWCLGTTDSIGNTRYRPWVNAVPPHHRLSTYTGREDSGSSSRWRKCPACKKCKWTLFENFHCRNKLHMATDVKCPGFATSSRRREGASWIRASKATIHSGRKNIHACILWV
jgi:hypothetical protein